MLLIDIKTNTIISSNKRIHKTWQCENSLMYYTKRKNPQFFFVLPHSQLLRLLNSFNYTLVISHPITKISLTLDLWNPSISWVFDFMLNNSEYANIIL